MEMSVEDSQREYLEQIEEHVSKGMNKDCAKVLDLLRKPTSIETFAPSTWNGLKKTPPVQLETFGQLPSRISPRARPVREALYANAKKEFDRLYKYFYVERESPIASPLVIAQKPLNRLFVFVVIIVRSTNISRSPSSPFPSFSMS